MDLEQPQPRNSDIDDATRLAASMRQLTVDPVHDDVAPDDLPDDQIAAQHLLRPAIGNIAVDSELTRSTHTNEQQSAINQPPTNRLALAVSLVVVAALTTMSVLAFLV
ncbi:hypothetical protein EOL96_01350 [Candidatus Saccharibacteria bacterium]|nr:hypothetical protein [Candidatus Saccharibacteria bacterium]